MVKNGSKKGQKWVENGSIKKSQNRPKIEKSTFSKRYWLSLLFRIFRKNYRQKVPIPYQNSRFSTFFGSEILRNRPELVQKKGQNREKSKRYWLSLLFFSGSISAAVSGSAKTGFSTNPQKWSKTTFFMNI